MSGALGSVQFRPGARLLLRSALLLVALAWSAWLLLEVFGRTYALSEWLIFRYARAWLWAAVFVVSSLSVGNLVVSALSTPGERSDGQLTLAFATGVYVFFLAVFVAGVAGYLNQTAFFAIPAALFAVGARSLVRTLREFSTRVRDGDVRFEFGPWEALAIAAGGLGLVAAFLPTLIPENLAYDARWYHLPLAEQYVVQGAIRRFPEGWTAGAMPHLSSILYTWAFLAPGADLFDRIVTATQLEFAVFLMTLPGIPLLVRSVLPGARARTAWALLFAFPSVMIYDSALSGAADHVSALWAIPAFVLTLRALRELRPRTCILLVIQLCGLVMTKYTSVMAVAFPVLAVAVRSPALAWLRWRGKVAGHGWLLGPLAALATALLLTTPHWLKNWAWYGDPLYPILHARFHPRPWMPDGDFIYQVFMETSFESRGTTGQKLVGGLRGLYDHSFWLYTWEVFHGWFPVFGSLFTFSLAALPFVRASRRLWALVIGAHLGILIWHIKFHEDRYLQTLLPWMVAATAAILILAWRSGLPARAGVLALVCVQLVGGTEAVFWPTHQMTGRSALGMVNDFFAQTMRRDFEPRQHPFQDHVALGRTLPKGSKVLLHHEHVRLGFGVPMVTDAYRTQYGLSYGHLGSPAALYDKLKEFGVTHVLWVPEQTYGEQSGTAEFVFHTFAGRYLVNRTNHGGSVLAELPKQRPVDPSSKVFVFSCGAGSYSSGLYELSDLNVSPLRLIGAPPPTLPKPRKALDGAPDPLLAEAGYALIQSDCSGAPTVPGFERVARQVTTDYMVRK